MFKGYVVFVEPCFFLVGELGIPEQKTHVHTCLYVVYMVNMLIDFWAQHEDHLEGGTKKHAKN